MTATNLAALKYRRRIVLNENHSGYRVELVTERVVVLAEVDSYIDAAAWLQDHPEATA